ncbi:MAG: DNA alkylation repair protein [Candidatus ainarchaeum sp.]|nr:DNA alkylation repair protein [Candidatus ainarchaeum sp.]
MEYEKVLKELKKRANPKNVEGMARFGINPKNTLGISVPELRALAKRIGKNHGLALKLWNSGIHEARMLAAFIDDPLLVDGKQMDAWIKDFDSWDVCDQACCDLFDQIPLAYGKAVKWTGRKGEFEKRAGFALMAGLAWHDKDAEDEKFVQFFPFIRREASDERNFVKKAVNWALRNIGKRNKKLNRLAIETAKEIEKMDSKSARWIAKDALRELQGEAVQKRLGR